MSRWKCLHAILGISSLPFNSNLICLLEIEEQRNCQVVGWPCETTLLF